MTKPRYTFIWWGDGYFVYDGDTYTAMTRARGPNAHTAFRTTPRGSTR
jgi:hypothetical protein